MFDYFRTPDVNIWGDILDVAVRSVVSIVVLFLLAKVLGNKQIKQLNFFDYVLGISVGSIAADMATNRGYPHHFFLIAMIIYLLVALIVGFVSVKSVKARRFLEGTPIVLVDKGKIVYKNLRKAQMTVNSLVSECRCAGYFDMGDVDTAVLETSGALSVLPKAKAKPVTAGDLKIETTTGKLHANVVIDGKLIVHNVHSVGKAQAWLMEELEKRKIKIEDVALATLDSEGNLQIYDKHVEPKRFDKFD